MLRIMPRRLPVWLVCCLLLLLPSLAQAQTQTQVQPQPDPADGILGDWLVKGGDAVIRIQRHGDLFYGNIVWQLHTTFSAHDGPELDGKPATDRFNPDPELRSRPIDGLLLIWDLHYDAEQQEWTGGRVYDLNQGHT